MRSRLLASIAKRRLPSKLVLSRDTRCRVISLQGSIDRVEGIFLSKIAIERSSDSEMHFHPDATRKDPQILPSRDIVKFQTRARVGNAVVTGNA
jgi:hypothetical protein